MRSHQHIAALALVAAASAQDCDYGKGHNCIKAQTTASVALPIPTLFPSASPPTFVYAIDDLDHADIIAITANNNGVKVPSASANGPMQAVSWWFSYDNGTVNLDSKQERAYTAWALESNSTSDLGGADGGCEGLLGADCVADLKTLFTDKSTLQIGSTAASGALFKFFATPPKNLRCPSIFWGDGSGRDLTLYGTSDTRPLVLNAQWFARLSSKLLLGAKPVPGNASYTHGMTAMRFRSFEKQKELAIVAFSLGYPAGGPGDRANNTLSMACLRAGAAAKDSTGGSESSGDKNNSGAALGISMGAMATAAMVLLLSM
ncbi:hypothetical protein VHEMI04559 [[Torrubiella] hemipterigena]|uniref:Uncharacterized protein n=1 Tax=[Torrubiella] hemipterigena TaxID=1531966 RepID=A0A0A1TGP4_9HYPO|nr:hypothetical protein VHEMI04559 [[Torrubiella] hemipterigena]